MHEKETAGVVGRALRLPPVISSHKTGSRGLLEPAASLSNCGRSRAQYLNLLVQSSIRTYASDWTCRPHNIFRKKRALSALRYAVAWRLMPDLAPAPSVTPEIVAEHGLTPDEFERIKKILGREPNFTELGIFSVMWSEHCSYKNSRRELKKFPTTG